MIFYQMKRIIGVNCPNKSLLIINGIEICFANSNKGLEKVLSYAFTLDETKIENKKIKRKVKEALKVSK